MRRRLFNVWAAISLALLAVVVAAIFSSAAVAMYSNYPAAMPPIYRTSVFKLYRGQFEFFQYDEPSGLTFAAPIGRSYQYKWGGNWMPGGKAIAGFEAGYLPPAGFRSTPGSK